MYITSLNSHWFQNDYPSKWKDQKNVCFSSKMDVFFDRLTLTARHFGTSGSSETTVVGRTHLDILRTIVGRQFLGRLLPPNTPFWLNLPQNELIPWQDPSRSSQLLYAENAGASKNKKNEKWKVTKSTHISCINFIILKVNHHHKYYIILLCFKNEV